MVEKNVVVRTFKKPLIWVGIISIIIIVIMGSIISTTNNSLSYCYERQNEMYEEYEYKCGEGLKKACIDEDKWYFEYGEDETFAICDTDRKERAICVDEETYWHPCSEDTYQVCVDKNADYIVCSEVNENARCLKENIYSIFTGTYVRECNIGEVAYCS